MIKFCAFRRRSEAKAKKGMSVTMEPETILEWKWFDLNNLPSNLYKPSKKCIEKYNSGIIYE